MLEIVDSNLPQKQQEGLETVIALVAVAMVTSMVVWMARHARGLKSDLEARAGAAVAEGSAFALVAMAFLAVLREGLETAVFLLSAFQASTNRAASSAGALLGIAVAIVIGYAIYKGGVKINLAQFFTATGLVLVLVAAGSGVVRHAHRPRGGVDPVRPGPAGRPELADQARLGAVGPAHGRARHPAEARP